MAQVRLTRVQKIYDGGVQAVQESSLEISDREFMVLVGPSGCGKSTTLRMIAGLEEISSGTIEIGDRIVNNVPPKDRDIAMVFQNYALYPHMTVYNNMAFGLKLRKLPRPEIEQRVREAARILGIEDFLERKPRALSGGQRQRVALGRAIVRQPSVFLLDEPLSNLDAKMRVQMRRELSLLHQRLQTTMIYVTHDQVEAMTLGQRICVMSDGRIQQVGSPLEIYDHPVNRFVAGFIGTPPINFFTGALKHQAVFSAPGMQIELGPALGRMAQSARATEDVTFGVRPEDLILCRNSEEQPGTPHINATVEIVEKLGDEQLIYCRVEGQDFVAKADSHECVQPGTSIKFAVKMEHTHLFCGPDGRNLATLDS